MSEVKISILMPIYNGADSLVKCLDSIKAQTFKEYELIMVNDGSVDKTEEICLSYAEKDERFRYFYQENKGASTAINWGHGFAKGEYIARIDCDDYVAPEFLSKPYSIAKKYNVDIVNFSHFYVTNGQEYRRTSILPKNKVLEKKDFLELLSFPNIPNKSTLLWFATMNFVKKKLLDDYNIKRDVNLIFQDGVFNLLCYLNAKGIYAINDPLYYYVNNPLSVTQSYREHLFNDINNQFVRKRSILEEYRLTAIEYKRYLAGYYLEHSLFYLISNEKNADNGLTAEFLAQVWNSEMYQYAIKHYKGSNALSLRRRVVIYFFRKRWLKGLVQIYKILGRR